MAQLLTFWNLIWIKLRSSLLEPLHSQPKFPLTLPAISLSLSSHHLVSSNILVFCLTPLFLFSPILTLTKSAFFNLRRIVQLRPFISVKDAETLIHAFVSSRLDYCNALFTGLPVISIAKLQYIQNSTRILTRTKCSAHISDFFFVQFEVCYTQVSGPAQTTCSNTLSSMCTTHFSHTAVCTQSHKSNICMIYRCISMN